MPSVVSLKLLGEAAIQSAPPPMTTSVPMITESLPISATPPHIRSAPSMRRMKYFDLPWESSSETAAASSRSFPAAAETTEGLSSGSAPPLCTLMISRTAA